MFAALSSFCYAAKVQTQCGEVSERFKEHAWKACVGETQPWVRIPPSPPSSLVISISPFGHSEIADLPVKPSTAELARFISRSIPRASYALFSIRCGFAGKYSPITIRDETDSRRGLAPASDQSNRDSDEAHRANEFRSGETPHQSRSFQAR